MLLYHLVVGQFLSSPEPLYALYRLIVTPTPLYDYVVIPDYFFLFYFLL